MKLNTIMSISINFLPILLIFLCVVYTKEFAYTANTYLGKCIAIAIIVLYSIKDILYGILVCILTILFYHTMSRNMDTENFAPDVYTDGITPNIYQQPFTYNIVSQYALESDTNQWTKLLNSLQTDKTISDINNTILTEPYTAGEFVPAEEGNAAAFRNQNCVHNKLSYKEFPVKREMTQHIFPEIAYLHEDDTCNICDPNCQFTVNKIMLEKQIIRDPQKISQ